MSAWMKRSLVPLTAIAVLLACAPALGAASIRTGTYKGKTDKGQPVRFKVTKSRKLVHFGFSKLRLKCSDGDVATVDPLESGPTRLPITKSGKFAVLATYDDGGIWGANGRIKGHKAKGWIRFQARFDANDQQVKDGAIVCDSGKRTFSARAKKKR